jgi:hypothetical protein
MPDNIIEFINQKTEHEMSKDDAITPQTFDDVNDFDDQDQPDEGVPLHDPPIIELDHPVVVNAEEPNIENDEVIIEQQANGNLAEEEYHQDHQSEQPQEEQHDEDTTSDQPPDDADSQDAEPLEP